MKPLCDVRTQGKLPSGLMAKYSIEKDAAARLNKTPRADWANLKGVDGREIPRNADNAPEFAAIMSEVCESFDPWTRLRQRISLACGFDSRNYHGAGCSF